MSRLLLPIAFAVICLMGLALILERGYGKGRATAAEFFEGAYHDMTEQYYEACDAYNEIRDKAVAAGIADLPAPPLAPDGQPVCPTGPEL